MIKKFFHQFASPKSYFAIANKFVKPFLVFFFLLYISALAWGLFFTPPDAVQGDSYRIIYMHVPAASVSQSIYYTMTIAAIVSMIWRMKMAGIFIKSMAPIGASFTFLALISGSIWGQPTWGTWWIWDARLTSTLVLFIFYIAIISLYSSFSEKK